MPDLQSMAILGLAGVVGYVGRRILEKQDELETLMMTELRAMDVRITVIEQHLKIGR